MLYEYPIAFYVALAVILLLCVAGWLRFGTIRREYARMVEDRDCWQREANRLIEDRNVAAAQATRWRNRCKELQEEVCSLEQKIRL